MYFHCDLGSFNHFVDCVAFALCNRLFHISQYLKLYPQNCLDLTYPNLNKCNLTYDMYNMSYVCITVYNILFESFCVADFVSCRQKSDCQSSSSKTTHFYFLRFCSMRRGQSVGASFKLLCKDIRYVPPNGCIWDV